MGGRMRHKGSVVGLWLLIVGLVACTYQPLPIQGEEGKLETQAGFVDVGGALETDTSRLAGRSSLALNSSGNPVVAWVEYNLTPASDLTDNNKIYVKRWQNNQWVQLGNGVSQSDIDNHLLDNPSLALRSDGNPIVAYQQCAVGCRQFYDHPYPVGIYVKQWNGSSWVALGNGLGTPAYDPALAIDSQNRPVVAFSACLTDPEGVRCNAYGIYVKRWNGTAWVLLGDILSVFPPQPDYPGGSIIPRSSAISPTIAIDSLDRPIVVWEETERRNSSVSHVYAKRWDGSKWVLLGTAVDRDDMNRLPYPLGDYRPYHKPSLIIDKKTNTPYVAYVDYILATDDDNLYVRKFDGSKWVQVSSSIDSAGSRVSNPSLSLTPDGRPMVAYDENYNGNKNIYIKVLSYGGTWGYVAARAERTITNNAYLPSLTVDATGNAIFSYEEEVAGQQRNVYVRKFQPDVPKTWTFLGGKINYGNLASNPIINFDSAANPVVVWPELRDLPQGLYYRLYVKRWDRSNWLPGEELNVAPSSVYQTSLVVAKPNNPVVAWVEDTLNGPSGNTLNSDVFVKWWNGTKWVRLGTALDTNAANIVEQPSVVLDSNAPTVMWLECVESFTDPDGFVYCRRKSVFVKRWNGSAWMPLGGAIETFQFTDSNNNNVSLASNFQFVSGQGLFLAFVKAEVINSAVNFTIELRRWNGTNWVKLSSIPTLEKYRRPSFSLTTDSTGQPAIAWGSCTKIFVGGVYNDEIGCTESTLFVQRWNGSSWEKRGMDVTASELYYDVKLKMENSTTPIVYYGSCPTGNEFCGYDGKLRILRWSGSSWVDLATPLDDNNPQTAPTYFTLDPLGRPVISWAENLLSGDLSIRIRRYQ